MRVAGVAHVRVYPGIMRGARRALFPHSPARRFVAWRAPLWGVLSFPAFGGGHHRGVPQAERFLALAQQAAVSYVSVHLPRGSGVSTVRSPCCPVSARGAWAEGCFALVRRAFARHMRNAVAMWPVLAEPLWLVPLRHGARAGARAGDFVPGFAGACVDLVSNSPKPRRSGSACVQLVVAKLGLHL